MAEQVYVEPPWTARVRARIRDFVPPEGQPNYFKDSSKISREIADVGVDALQATADLFPGEPFVYSDNDGDLVFEASASPGSFTMIIGATSAVAFAVVDDLPEYKRVDLTPGWRERLCMALRELLELLRTGRAKPGVSVSS